MRDMTDWLRQEEKLREKTLLCQMEKLRFQARQLGRVIAKESGLLRLVEWIDMVVFRWQLKRNIRKNRKLP